MTTKNLILNDNSKELFAASKILLCKITTLLNTVESYVNKTIEEKDKDINNLTIIILELTEQLQSKHDEIENIL